MNLKGKVTCKQNLQHYSQSVFPLAGIYILSAVRTPIGLYKGVLNEFSASQLSSFTFKEASQRALVPCKNCRNVFLGCDLHSNSSNEIINRTGLSKSANVSFVSPFGMKSFIEGIKFLMTGSQRVCFAGGVDSTSNQTPLVNQKYLSQIKSMLEDGKSVLKNNQLYSDDFMKFSDQDYKNFFKASKNGAFFDEIIKIDFIKKGSHIVLYEDEAATLHFSTGENSDLKYSHTLTDGAAAVVLSTEDYIRNEYLNPLAKIISFSEESAMGSDPVSTQCLAIEKALKMGGYQCNEIRRWEIDSVYEVVSNCVNNFKIDPSLVNKHGGALSLGYPVGMLGIKSVCHLVHSLIDGELGCVVTCDFQGSASAVIIKKLCSRSSGKPRLTLYTKNVCPLCDELKEELKAFEGRFSLKEIDIEAEENKKYKHLFKYDIPVLFLDGKFLCKHKFDAQHFNRRLAAYENVT